VPRYVAINELFNRTVTRMGGRVLDHELGADRKFQNADFYFPQANVVAELKSLEEDMFSRPEFMVRVAAQYKQWVQKGWAAPMPRGGQVYTRSLRAECQQEFFMLLRDRLCSSVLRQANRQIRETKSHLMVPDAKGILILVNEGNAGLRPGMLIQLIEEACRGRFTSLDQALFCTINLTTHGGRVEDSRIWAPIPLPARMHRMDAFLYGLGDKVLEEYSREARVEVRAILRRRPRFEEMEGLSYRSPPKATPPE